MSFFDNLPDDILIILEKEQIVCPKVILKSSETYLENLGLSKSQIEIVKKEAARSTNVIFTNFYELVKDPVYKKRLSFGCKNLNDLMDGGLMAKGVTEIHGEAGSGKTQILLQLSLMVQLPENLGGFNKGAIYVCTECNFPSERLYQLIEAFKEKYAEHNEIKYAENIFVKCPIINENHLLKCVFEEIPNLMKKNQIGLIVIDSIAGVFRQGSNYIERAESLRKIVRTLSHLIDEYKCAVVCSNQVSSKLDNGKEVSPCLGVTWSNLIAKRIRISKFIEKTNNDNSQQLRQFELISAPESGYKECKFQIVSKGIVDVSSNS